MRAALGYTGVMGGPFDRPPMTQQQYIAELEKRGFRLCGERKLWVGPFNITITTLADQSNFHIDSGMNNPMGLGNSGLTGGSVLPGISGLRKTLLAEIDEKLRAARGLPRPLHRPAYDPPNPHPPPH